MKTPNAAILGLNDEELTGQTVSTCSAECCARLWCNSFDFEREAGICRMSSKNEEDVGLKTDYDGNPHDYYARPGQGIPYHTMPHHSPVL